MSDDEGSVLPLIVAYVALCLALVLVCVNATSLYLARKELDGLASAAALAAADGFDIVASGDGVRIALDRDEAADQALEVLAVSPTEAELVSVDTADAASARVTIRAEWHPFLLGFAAPGAVALESRATSRSSLAP
ncbi:pilus assembly protein TadG-related protein [Microbacterium indicum]|uniref:pilus assembly protein TadG-related protein n=1 Tax=Microbacterium indicum TaxID=358100 RepID=UPI00040909F4|nr:pilus assembly protein TadG-related protein [Microbacterium indicum]